jgi:hypothetical protein
MFTAYQGRGDFGGGRGGGASSPYGDRPSFGGGRGSADPFGKQHAVYTTRSI